MALTRRCYVISIGIQQSGPERVPAMTEFRGTETANLTVLEKCDFCAWRHHQPAKPHCSTFQLSNFNFAFAGHSRHGGDRCWPRAVEMTHSGHRQPPFSVLD